MMVSDLDFTESEEPENVGLTGSTGFSDYENEREPPLFAASTFPGVLRKMKERKTCGAEIKNAKDFIYPMIAGRDHLRLVVLEPGTGNAPARCSISSQPLEGAGNYTCLSYCWETTKRDSAIFIRLREDKDYRRLRVTENLHNSLRSLRDPKGTYLLWIDQICINQDDIKERAEQVSVMGDIYKRAMEVIIWLGANADRSDKLCAYAKKMRRGDDERKSNLSRIMSHREAQAALQKLLLRPWFTRVWVIPEIVLARHITVQCGRSQMSWNSLVRLVRDIPSSDTVGFDKQSCLLGNKRQRIALMQQMTQGKADITQLLIVAKASEATDLRDKIYAFCSLSPITIFPDYSMSIEKLYVAVAEKHISAIHNNNALAPEDRTFQLMSILYSAGKLHQRLELPSWVPDWTAPWDLAPLWSRTSPISDKVPTGRKYSTLRSEFRAGLDELQQFQITYVNGFCGLLLTSIILDEIVSVIGELPPSSPGTSETSQSSFSSRCMNSPVVRYGRVFFETKGGYVGLATPEIAIGDLVAIIPGGDVPVILRPVPAARDVHVQHDPFRYILMCNCLVESPNVMIGKFLRDSFGRFFTSRDVLIV